MRFKVINNSSIIFCSIVFTMLVASIGSFKIFFISKTIEEEKVLHFLTAESISLFLINIFTYLFIFNLISIFFPNIKNEEQSIEKEERTSSTQTKRYWQSITKVLEEKSHHSLLNEFKVYELRTEPYELKENNYNLKELFKLNTILSIYYKIYNIIISFNHLNIKDLDKRVDKEKEIQDIKIFLKSTINKIQRHHLSMSLYLVKNILIKYTIFTTILLSFFKIISLIINNNEIFGINLLFLATIFVLLFISFLYLVIKKYIYKEFILPTSYFSHYLNKFTFVTIAFTLSISAIIIIKKIIFEHFNFSFYHYNDLAYTFGKLLLPSSFTSLLDKYPINTPNSLSAFEILLYKLIFIMVLGYIVFTTINFAIKKYDSIYFTNIQKTLMPPELATLSIKFLLLILFMSLIYGTFFNYIHVMDSSLIIDNNISTTSSSNVQSNDNQTMSDYIPFSIFIAIIGGLLTMATKDLLENYFAGLSLQMDAPYEEHDRITLSDSEMLEVRHIGIRADKFYGIKSNAEIIIPHKKIIQETIINYTLPTLDYREEVSIYIPQINNNYKNEHRSIPKRAEMLLLLSIYVNTGVKIPILDSERLDIKEELKEFRIIADTYKDRQLVKEKNTTHAENVLSHEEYETIMKEEAKSIEDIWKKLKISNDLYQDEKSHHPLSKLFIHNLIETVESAIKDSDHLNESKEVQIIAKIKSIVASILISVENYQNQSNILHHHIDKNFAIRKYRMFRDSHKPKDDNSIQEMANELVHINYYYFILADSLWKLKDLQNSLYRKREVDSTSIEILDVPRVTTEHIYSGEGKINYWKVTANITLELAEQSNEIIHHINMYIDNLWNDFNLPKYYETDAEQSKSNNIDV